MNDTAKQNTRRSPLTILIIVLAIGLLIGGGLSYTVSFGQINGLQQQILALQSQTGTQPSPVTTTVTLPSSTGLETTTVTVAPSYAANASLPELYDEVKDSVVTIMGIVSQSTRRGTILGVVEGSGFVYNTTGSMVIITNNHVVDGASNITVTFRDGDSYPAAVLGTDAYADIAVISVDAPQIKLSPLTVVSSSTLRVFDPVLAIGSPFGLAG